MVGVGVTYGKGAGPESTYRLYSVLCPPSVIWEALPTKSSTQSPE